MKKTFIVFLLLIASIKGYSQFSKIHYIPPITTSSSSMTPSQQYLYISTPTVANVNVKITSIGGIAPFTVTVNSTTPYVYKIPDATPANTQLFTPQTVLGKLTNKGFIIEADDLIYTNVRVMGGGTSQAGGLVAKGKSAMGKTFRIGGMLNKWNPLGSNWSALMNFASFIATENDTKVTITLSDPLAIGTPMTNGTTYTGPITITLQKNESYIMAFENTSAAFRSSYMLGGLIQSDKDIVVNCGSFGGNSYTPGVTGDLGTPTNNNVSDGASSTGDFKGKDIGFDQIVPLEKTGKEYIFVKGLGSNALERVMIIAHFNGTQIFKNGSATPSIILNAGEYHVYDGSDFVNGNLYVTSSENVFAYQAIGGNTNLGNQNMFFVPPINCATPNIVDNIPLIEKIGTTTNVFSGNINIVTEIGSVVKVNGVTAVGPVNVTGPTNPKFIRFTLSGRTGNIKVTSTSQVYVSYFGRDDNATYGGYYSGFDTKPEIQYNTPPIGTSICMPNIVLRVTSAVATDKFQWQYNGVDIIGETTSTYTPKSVATGGKGAGYYSVNKTITGCGLTTSEQFPVSECAVDGDSDGDTVINNIDMDLDNDGITNFNESYKDQNINVSGSSGTVAVGNYSNSYTSTTTPNGVGNTITGNPDGSFTTSLVAGNMNAITQNLNFTNPVSLGLKYNPLAGATVASLSNAAFVVKSDMDKTMTISNPTNQLLIDTDYDGIYESGVTEFSSFDVRFILNPAVLLPAVGTAPAVDFKIQTYLSNSISFTHQNLSSTVPNTANFSFIATSIPKDSDGDGTPDQLDTDSDNDGILDIVEGQPGNLTLSSPFLDANKNGLDDIFQPLAATPAVDTDGDLIPDYADVDSDNDGILDSVETAIDTDADGIKNYREKDSDGDTCSDVVEAGFTDPNADGILGVTPVTVDAKGKVTSGTDGYTTPNGNYLVVLPAPTKAVVKIQNSDCPNKYAELKVETDNISPTPDPYTYKWERSIDNGSSWTLVVDNSGAYAGATTDLLKIYNININGYQYRVEILKKESACRALTSNIETVTFNGSPETQDYVFSKCDTDINTMNGKSVFDLTTANVYNNILKNTTWTNETFTYYKSPTGASTKAANDLIGYPAAYNPAAYENETAYQINIWVRVENQVGCSSIAMVTLNVGANTTNGFVAPTIVPATLCDDVSADGKADFDLAPALTELKKLFPATGYTVEFYPSATATTPIPIPTTSLYTSTGNGQDIYYRVTNTSTDPALSGCSSTGTYFKLNVETLPVPKAVGPFEHCDDDALAPNDGTYPFTFGATSLESQIANGQNVTVTFYDDAGLQLPSPLPNPFTTKSQTITAVVANADPNSQKCAAVPISINFKVNPIPVVKTNVAYNVCDTDILPFDGKAVFILSSLNSNGLISTGTNETYTYYSTKNDAIAATNAISSISYTNNTLYTEQVWARVENNTTHCFNVTPITLNVVAQFTANYELPAAKQPAPVCDDAVLGTNTDGISKFDLTNAKAAVEANITDTRTGIYTFAYYNSQQDALAQNNPITNFLNYRNITQNTQKIWVRVKNTLNGTCESIGAYITVKVEALPVAKAIKESYKECDDDTDQKFSFINTVDNEVRKGRTDVIVEYYDNSTGVLLFPTNTQTQFPSPYNTGNLTVRAKVINSTPQLCEDETLIVFQVDVKPVTPATSIAFTECYNEQDPLEQDGKFPFDTSSIQSTILGTQPGMTVKYFDESGNPLPSPLPNPFLTATQTVKVVVENPLNTNCPAQGSIIFTVNALPNINMNTNGGEDELVCSNNPGLLVQLNAGIQDGSPTSSYTYQWSKDGIALAGETSYDLKNVNQEGIYTVEVTNTFGCSKTRTIRVTASNVATIESIKVVDLSDVNTVTVNVLGPGIYEYSLGNSGYQDSNFFNNVAPGIYEVLINDKKGCGPPTSQTIAVVGAPKFFTPNNDGYNDYWNVTGLNTSANKNSIIYIFDRYGKLLKQISPLNEGWDGTINGNVMPGADYWYTAKLQDGRETKGHFSLKR